jgi:hypothetical protein
MHDDRACQVREKGGQVGGKERERERGVKEGRHRSGKLRFSEDVWQVVYHLAERGSRWRLTGTLLVYEDVRSGKVQVGVEVRAGVGVRVPTARQKLGLLGRLHR